MTDDLSVIFALLESRRVKSACKMLVKLAPGYPIIDDVYMSKFCNCLAVFHQGTFAELAKQKQIESELCNFVSTLKTENFDLSSLDE